MLVYILLAEMIKFGFPLSDAPGKHATGGLRMSLMSVTMLYLSYCVICISIKADK